MRLCYASQSALAAHLSAVADQKSFSRAAEPLFVSQPAVSRAVREMERQLDLPLLERGAAGAKGLRLTANGAALFGLTDDRRNDP